VTLVLTAGEEIGCEGARYLADQRLLDRAGAIVIAEPTANYPYIGHKGLAWFEIETLGVTAHGSMPELGENAIVKMAKVIGALDGFHFPIETHPVMGEPTLNVGTIHGGLNTNSVPDEARITVDTRTVPGIDHGHLEKSLATLLAPHAASVRKIVDCASLYTDPGDEWIAEVFEVCAPFLGGRPVPKTITFSTDGADLKRGYGGTTPRRDPRARGAEARAPDRRVVLHEPHRGVGGHLPRIDEALVRGLSRSQSDQASFAASTTRKSANTFFSLSTGMPCATFAPRGARKMLVQ
jgi:acetylornithine deacetylase/succinyl-diaminopimelate desuccinylase-like protein